MNQPQSAQPSSDVQLHAQQSGPVPTSEHAPLPIGCTSLDEEQQRLWDHFYRQGQERDKAREEAWKKRKAEALQREQEKLQQPKQPEQPKKEVQPMTAMEIFQHNLSKRSLPQTAKKLNLPPAEIQQYLTIAYQKECTIRNMKPVMDAYTVSYINNVSRWLSAESHTKGSLLLRGYVGVGKTTMLCAIRSLFVGFGLQGFQIKSAFDINALAKDKAAFDELKRAEFLGIDDLGQEPSTIKDYGNERNPFEELISARYDALRQTLISTNLVVVDGNDQIAERYGTRIADRLREMCNTINYDPNQKSYRQ